MNQLRRVLFACLLGIILSSPVDAAKTFSGTVNINTASPAELAMLPGIGAAKAQAIVDQRKAKPFSSADELLLIKGIGDKLYAKMKPFVALSGTTTLKELKGTDSPNTAVKQK